MSDDPKDKGTGSNETAGQEEPGAARTTPVTESPAASAGASEVPKKADPVKRFLAVFIDGLLAAMLSLILGVVIPVLGFFLGALLGAAYMLVRDGLTLEFMDQRSLGKKLLKLRPVRLDGSRLELNDSMKRNWVFAVPNALQAIPILGQILGGLLGMVLGLVECILVLTDPEGRRWGDKLADTRVIEVDE
ncbi:MAG: RDD family protein [Gemmatimonadetes bacterium]|nr:RDD family protein [Gemmatimonadota bacterium]